MCMITATATEMQNNFGHYLNFVMSVQESIVTKNGKEAGRFTSKRDSGILLWQIPLREFILESFNVQFLTILNLVQ